MVGAAMECSPTLEPAYLNLPGWRCVPVYALPLSPTARTPATPPPALDAHSLLPPNIPQDPRQWSRQNVFTWLEWCVDTFSIFPLEVDNFYMNGRGLCLLKKSDFSERAPRCGDVLYNALQILLKSKEQRPNGQTPPANNISASLLQHAVQERGAFGQRGSSPWARSISSDFHSMGQVIHESEHAHVAVSHFAGSDVDSTTASSPPPPPDDVVVRSPGATDSLLPNSNQSMPAPPIRLTQFGEIGNSTEKINVRLLWDFLQQLLNDSQQRYNCCIVWKDKARGIFKITDPHRLAALWGKQKNHLNMNFDKMSRALRYYYRVRILQKEPGERHCYRFLLEKLCDVQERGGAEGAIGGGAYDRKFFYWVKKVAISVYGDETSVELYSLFLRHPNELRHCKQRALLSRDNENAPLNGSQTDIDGALDMSIKEEGSSPGDVD